MVKRTLAVLAVIGLAGSARAAGEPKSPPATSRPARNLAEYASCSSLCQVRQPLEKAAEVIAGMGYKYLDLSCLHWPPSPPHVNVTELLKDFDQEASRVEKVLSRNRLRVSNLTFDGINPAADARRWEDYTRRFDAVMRLAVRLNGRLVNLMAPPKGADKQAAAEKLRLLQKTAEKYKIKLTLETHTGQLTEFPADAVRLCRKVPGLGLTLDPSHYYAGPNQGKSFDEVYPYVQGTGFRAGGMEWKTVQMPWGSGPIDFVENVRKLEAQGYDGFYVCEYIEGFNELDAVEQSRRFLSWIRSLGPGSGRGGKD